MSDQNQSKLVEKKERISVATNEGLLTEEDLSLLLDLPVKTAVSYIDSGRLPGCRIGPQGAKIRTLTSVKDLIQFIEKKSKEGQIPKQNV